MKKVLIVLLLLVVFVLPAAAADELNTEQEKLGYAIGMNIGMNMKQQQVDADPDQVAAGLAAASRAERLFCLLTKWLKFWLLTSRKCNRK